MGENYRLEVGDSLKLLRKFPDHSIPIIVTGIPDMDELAIESIDEYLDWIDNATNLLFTKAKIEGYVIFVQTDRKIGGEWIDKSYHLTNNAYQHGWKLMWHKLCLNRPVGSSNLHRPTYSHILCYSVKGRPGNALPDVVYAGDRLYPNATPTGALELIFAFLKNKHDASFVRGAEFEIVDPFVGRGSVIYYALQNAWTGLGIDLDANQIHYAEELLADFDEAST